MSDKTEFTNLSPELCCTGGGRRWTLIKLSITTPGTFVYVRSTERLSVYASRIFNTISRAGDSQRGRDITELWLPVTWWDYRWESVNS